MAMSTQYDGAIIHINDDDDDFTVTVSGYRSC